MWTVASTRIPGFLHGTTVPLFDPICRSFGVCIVEDRLAEPVTAFATLMVYPRILFISRVHSYGDGNLLAGPSSGFTGSIVACKSTCDACVVTIGAASVAVDFIKVEREECVVQ